MSDTIKAYWYKRPDSTEMVANVGDMLTPIILKHLLKREIEWSNKTGRILACGSIIDSIHAGDIIWGAGLIGKKAKIPVKKGVKILAVRGKLTQKALIEKGYYCPEIYGEPSMLMPEIYHPKIEIKHKYGYIPHYVEKNEFYQWFGGRQINIINDPFDFIDQLLECKYVITSSLHAFILAQAYNIPVEYTQLTNRIIGGRFKYYDYLSGKSEYSRELFIKSLTDGLSE